MAWTRWGCRDCGQGGPTCAPPSPRAPQSPGAPQRPGRGSTPAPVLASLLPARPPGRRAHSPRFPVARPCLVPPHMEPPAARLPGAGGGPAASVLSQREEQGQSPARAAAMREEPRPRPTPPAPGPSLPSAGLAPGLGRRPWEVTMDPGRAGRTLGGQRSHVPDCEPRPRSCHCDRGAATGLGPGTRPLPRQCSVQGSHTCRYTHADTHTCRYTHANVHAHSCIHTQMHAPRGQKFMHPTMHICVSHTHVY